MKKSLILLFFLSSQLIISQSFELGKVTKEELQETVYAKDSSAAAAILFNKGETYFVYDEQKGFTIITEVETKIKIYKKEGLDWGNKVVSFYNNNSDRESVNFSKAVTYNLENGKIEKSKLKSDGEFDEVTNKFWSKKKIAMPNVKVGSIVEYKYTIKSPFFSNFPEWDFQTTIPVSYSEYVTKIPEYFQYNVYRNGWLFPKEVKTREEKSISFNVKDRDLIQGLGQRSAKGTTYSTQKIYYTENKVTYTLEDIAAVKDETHVNNINNYIAKVQHELSGTLFPNSMYKSYASTWEDVAKTIYESEDFGQELEKNNYFGDDVKAILTKTISKNEQLIALLELVKSKVKWDNYQSIYCDKGVKRAYKEGTGNVAEINLMLVAMLREAGFDANPVLVSTRSNGISIFPSRTAFNYVIAAVKMNENYILLDATTKYSTPNILPLRVLNWNGRLVRKDKTSEEIDLTKQAPSVDNCMLMCAIDETGKIDGKLREQYYGYNAFLYRDNFNDLSADTYLEKLENRYKKIEISDVSTQNKNDLNKPIVESYKFTSNNSVEIIGDRMYFSPLLFFQLTENPFKQDTRTYPIDYNFPFKDSFNISIKIPEGYEIESMPTPTNLAMENNAGSFKFNLSNTGNNIQLVSSFEVNTAMIPMQDYASLKLFYKEMINKQTEKIVLIKKL